MKREINCTKCGQQWERPRSMVPEEFGGENEHLMRVPGFALYDFMCDGCGKALPTGATVIAVSVWVEGRGIPYTPWETEFIRPATAKELDAVDRLTDKGD